MLNAWCSLAALIALAATEINKEQFYEALKNRRLSEWSRSRSAW